MSRMALVSARSSPPTQLQMSQFALMDETIPYL